MVPSIPHPSKDIKESLGTELRGKTVVLCITGSVAAVHCPEIARKIMRHGAEVYTVFSDAAQTIIHPYLMEWATGNPVVTRLSGKIEHVALAGNHSYKADLVLVAPATANTISKIATAIDDTPVTSTVTTAFGSGIPIMIVPAMHYSMYNHPILKENIQKLEALGVEFIGPRIEEGKAKLATPKEVVNSVIRKLGAKHDLMNVKVLVTAGPTIEYIDPVRILTNRSSGRMGIEIARSAWNRGAEVTLVYGRGSIPPPEEINVVRAETSEEMYDAVVSELESKEYEVVIAAAAVADWTPTTPKREKVATRKTAKLSIQLRPTKKIVDKVKEIRQEAFLVLFKAEHGVSNDELIERAYKRLQAAQADLIVANDVGRPGVGFEAVTNELFIIDKEKNVVHIQLTSKQEAATRLLDIIASKLR
jgi:phosphopantothenoylcysteine decarboxylase/phosphopantothenate--cysteine ligase